MNIFMAIVVIACGVFSLCGAWFNWDWFFNNRKARGIVSIFGRTGARIFYGILGVFIMSLGIAVLVMI